jgi:hypothetical protein
MDIDDFLDKENQQKKVPEQNLEKGSASSAGIQGQIKAEIETIRRFFQEKKFEEAERKYVEAKELYVELTRQQSEEQNHIYTQLEAVNNEMLQGLHKLRHETEQKVEVLQNLIAKANLLTKNNDFKGAAQVYEEIDTFFKSLSDVIPEKKIMLEHQIAALHVTLINKSNMAADAIFRQKYQQTHDLLVKAFDSLKQHNYAEAISLYNQINSLYEEMPKGFLYEKAVLYQQILKLFKLVNVHHKHEEKPQ